MEIMDYLRVAKSRRRLLIALPLIATIAAVALSLLGGRQYQATATVSSDTLVGGTGPYSGTQAVSQFVAAFTSASQSPTVRQGVLAATGVPPTEQSVGMKVTAVAQSSDMQLVFTHPDRDKVEPVLRETAQRTLSELFSSRSAQAKAERDRAAAAATEATAALSAVGTKYKLADPTRAYQAQLTQLAGLQQSQATLRATGNPVAAAALDAPIGAVQATLDGYGPILTEYNKALADQQAATADLAAAQSDFRRAEALDLAAKSEGVLYLGGTQAVELFPQLLVTALVVLAVSFFLTVLLVFLLELLGRARSAARGQPHPDPGSDTGASRAMGDPARQGAPALAREQSRADGPTAPNSAPN